ncbi:MULTISPECIES: FeoA family protein [Vibrio]|uniref:Ferrous iron transport protein A n=2 Tax=Vibrio TaxID=662 RepID=A0A7X4RTI7_9VIBR|nr:MULTISPECIES: FeoA family protein [Vibrio]MBF8999537.1 ferrous iron transport protein A [Vibrio nitrifigilis]MZI92109.1 ferrous iron transport protein A [Vibrio eleionomae]
MKLSELKSGEVGCVTTLQKLSQDARKRLMTMGMLPNTNITLVRRAPMGDPLQVEVRGVSIALRVSIADDIEVERV